MRKVLWVASTLVLAAALAARIGAPVAAADASGPAPDADPVIKKLGLLVGGKWVTRFKNTEGVPFGELSFRWGPDGRSILSTGVLGQGTPKPEPVQARFGWDAARKSTYYLDLHGDTVYFGTMRLEGDTVVYDFKSLVGTPEHWISRETYPDNDTCVAVMSRVVDGKEQAPSHRIHLLRVR